MAIRTDHKAKMRVRKGDSVQVISGKDRGVTGRGIVTQEAPVHASNVMVVCPKCDKPSRLGSRQETYTDERSGKTKTRPIRVCKRCGNEF